jgi:tetratricopeptide (TPR) repeat protein
VSRSRTDINNRDYDRAIAALTEAIRLDLENCRRLKQPGYRLCEQRRLRPIADFNDAIRLNPKNAVALSQPGRRFGIASTACTMLCAYNPPGDVGCANKLCPFRTDAKGHVSSWHLSDIDDEANVRFAPTADICKSEYYRFREG